MKLTALTPILIFNLLLGVQLASQSEIRLQQKTGSEVAQVYIKPLQPALPRPEKELKAFEKVYLQPGEKKDISLLLDNDIFLYFNDVTNQWTTDKGNYTIPAGSSSADITVARQHRTIKITG